MPLALAVCTVATAIPAHAGSKTTSLYLVNVGAPAAGGCTMDGQLSLKPADGNECSGTLSAVNGNGIIENDTYLTTKKFAGVKVDTSRPLTGTIYIAHFPLIYASVGPAGTPHSLPGYVSLDVTVKLDSVKVGTQHIEGVVMPIDGLKQALSFTIPASLKGKTAKKVSVAFEWTTAVGLSGVSYTSPYASVITVPSR
jgi:hypothetical protein